MPSTSSWFRFNGLQKPVYAYMTAAVFGVVPAFRSVGARLETTLREGDRGNTGAAGTQRMRAVLVVTRAVRRAVSTDGKTCTADSAKAVTVANINSRLTPKTIM